MDNKTVAAVRRDLSEEFLTLTKTEAKTKSEEFLTEHAKPNNRASLIGDVLRTIPDHALIAECRRRGLTVEADDV